MDTHTHSQNTRSINQNFIFSKVAFFFIGVVGQSEILKQILNLIDSE
jgi:hypothetical protein